MRNKGQHRIIPAFILVLGSVFLISSHVGPAVAKVDEKTAAASETRSESEGGEIANGDKGKYKRRHTRVMEFLLSGETQKARGRLDKWFKEDPEDPENYYMLAVIECQAGNVPKAVEAMNRAVKLGMLPERFVAGTHSLLGPLKGTPEFAALAKPFEHRLVSGPMVAAVTQSGAKIWVRTAVPAKVRVTARPAAGAKESSEAKVVESNAASDLTAVADLENLKPLTKYRYEVAVNGVVDATRQEYQSFTTAPRKGSPAKFTVAFGGCAGYTPSNEKMWDVILGFKPQAMWLLGDNEYIDAPEMPPLQRYCFYRRQARPEFRRLVAGTPTYAIYDDHDFGPNDCAGGPDIEKPAWKRAVWNVFQQTWVNPYYGGGEKNPGCWFDYYYGDVHFIFLDGRYYRATTAKHGVNPPTMLGPVQKKWLFETLANSTAKIKVLVSPVTFELNTKGEVPDTWNGFKEEREEIFDFLTAHRIDGVVLVSSDRHRSDLLENKRPNDYTLYEFNSGRLTNDSYHPTLPSAVFSYNELPTFGLISFDTTSPEESITYRIIDIEGHEHLGFTVNGHDLRVSPTASKRKGDAE